MILNTIRSEYIVLTKKTRFALVKGVCMYLNDPKFKIVCKIRRIVNCTPFSRKRKRLSDKLMLQTGIEIGGGCVIGKALKIEHLSGIVIGKKAVIGDNCTLYHQVTLGKKNGGYPTIGNNVTLYPGAKILGNICVGEGAVIGAGAVVTKDVEPHTVMAGIPARPIKKRNIENKESVQIPNVCSKKVGGGGKPQILEIIGGKIFTEKRQRRINYVAV